MKPNTVRNLINTLQNLNLIHTGDLCIIKDVLQHLCNNDIINILTYLIKNKVCKYIIICNCCQQTVDNENIENGSWRQLSALKAPLNLFNPEILFNYNNKEVSVITI